MKLKWRNPEWTEDQKKSMLPAKAIIIITVDSKKSNKQLQMCPNYGFMNADMDNQYIMKEMALSEEQLKAKNLEYDIDMG